MHKTFYVEIGNRLRRLRKSKGFTQDDIGKIIGLSRASVSNIEKGRHKIQLHILCDYSNILNVPISEIII